MTDRTSTTVAENTRITDEMSTTNRETNTFGTTTDMRSTNYGTSTTVLTTQRQQTTSPVLRPESTWPSSTTTQQHNVETTVPFQETTKPGYPHYHSSSTPEMDNEIEHMRTDQTNKNVYETENEILPHENTPISEIEQSPIPESEPEPPYYPQPPQTPYNTGRPKVNRGGRISSEAEERTAMIIGIVAGALIAVVLVILLLIWLKSNGDRNYKADPDKRTSYGQGANAALLGNNSGTNGSRHPLNGSNVPLNGSLRVNGNDKQQVPGLLPQKPKKRDSKDIKEWYV